jgi:hypothetical protein
MRSPYNICTKPLHLNNIHAKIIHVWGVASVFLSKSGLSPLFLHIEPYAHPGGMNLEKCEV